MPLPLALVGLDEATEGSPARVDLLVSVAWGIHKENAAFWTQAGTVGRAQRGQGQGQHDRVT